MNTLGSLGKTWIVVLALMVTFVETSLGATLQWASGSLDIAAPASITQACTLRVIPISGYPAPDGYLLRYEGDGRLSFESQAGQAGHLVGPPEIIGMQRYLDLQVGRDTLVLGASYSEQPTEVIVRVASGAHFSIAVAEVASGRLSDPAHHGSVATIGGGVFGGAVFVPAVISANSLIAEDSLHFSLRGIGLSSVERWATYPAVDSNHIAIYAVNDTLVVGAIPLSIARRIDAVRFIDVYGRSECVALEIPDAIRRNFETVIVIGMRDTASLADHLAILETSGVRSAQYPDGTAPSDLGQAQLPISQDLPRWLFVRLISPSLVAPTLAAVRSMAAVAMADSQPTVWGAPLNTPTDPYWGEQWHLHNVTTGLCAGNVNPQPGATAGLDRAWDFAPGPSDIRVGFIDSGISSAAYDQDFYPGTAVYGNDQLDAFHTFSKSFVSVGPSPGAPPTNEDKNPFADPGDGHGTKVSSLAVSKATFGSSGVGIAGLARYGVPVSLKVNVDRSLGPSELIAAVDYGSRAQAAGGAECRIINNSNGFIGSKLSPTTKVALAATVKGAWLRGAFVVSASGNEYFNTATQPSVARFPASWGEINVAVGATSFTGDIWSSRNLFGQSLSTAGTTHGPFLSLLAPGAGVTHMNNLGQVVSLNGANCVWSESEFSTTFCGTSFAAPVVSGAAAWLLALQPSLTNDDLREVLERTATDMAAPGWDPVTGHGRLDVGRAAELVSFPNWIAHGSLGAGTGNAMAVHGVPVSMNLTILNPSITGLSGTHPALRYDVRGEAQFPVQYIGPPSLWVRRRGENRSTAEMTGIDGSGVWDEASRLPWAEAVGVNGSFYQSFHTYVYELLDQSGAFRWYPCRPEDVRIAYTTIGQVSDVGAPAPGSRQPVALTAITNPSRGLVRFALSSLSPGPLRVEVFDPAGRVVARLFDGTVAGSSLALTWDRTAGGARIPSGIYLARLEQPGRRVACRVAVVR